ncbi:MAG: DNA damage-inducible protein D [Actinomycetia bacterium]|nr:DNA damage-inducible protein D [Actinomycetes bacterium]
MVEQLDTFDALRQLIGDKEFWFARDLQSPLGYNNWQNFSKVVDRAMLACDAAGYSVPDHFTEVSKMIDTGKTAKRPVLDYQLSRYACYLIVQNGDPRKEQIALGQTYFAIQTYRQELSDKYQQLAEDKKRLLLRGDIKQMNQLLTEAAKDAGVISPEEFAVFQNRGYQGLYGGLSVSDIHKRKHLEKKDRILDFMGSEEMIANLFRISQTQSKISRDQVKGKTQASYTHFTVGKEVRETIMRIGGVMPEDLPTPDKGIIELEEEAIRKLKAKNKKMMTDE